ncbi:MAG: hypothetical protein CMM09_05170 [Rhodospirillaceae bacterium]|jgi:hypothetical protein|nr:hypothetical protein [Rhodospirillaceae bacterium]
MLLHAGLRVKLIIYIIKLLFFIYNKLFKENACARWPDALFPTVPGHRDVGGGQEGIRDDRLQLPPER